MVADFETYKKARRLYLKVLLDAAVADTPEKAGENGFGSLCESQISGAATMQLGFTMFEKMHFDGGQVTNASLADYKIPGIHDLPVTFENEIVEAYQSNGPFGGKGVGEVATFCVSPAIGNAIDDAVGVRLTELPLNPEAVLRALRAKENRPIEDAV